MALCVSLESGHYTIGYAIAASLYTFYVCVPLQAACFLLGMLYNLGRQRRDHSREEQHGTDDRGQGGNTGPAT